MIVKLMKQKRQIIVCSEIKAFLLEDYLELKNFFFALIRFGTKIVVSDYCFLGTIV